MALLENQKRSTQVVYVTKGTFPNVLDCFVNSWHCWEANFFLPSFQIMGDKDETNHLAQVKNDYRL